MSGPDSTHPLGNVRVSELPEPARSFAMKVLSQGGPHAGPAENVVIARLNDEEIAVAAEIAAKQAEADDLREALAIVESRRSFLGLTLQRSVRRRLRLLQSASSVLEIDGEKVRAPRWVADKMRAAGIGPDPSLEE